MQIVSWGDDLHEMTTPIFWGNKKSISKSAESFSQGAESFWGFFFVCNSFALKVTFSSKRHFLSKKGLINCFMVLIRS